MQFLQCIHIRKNVLNTKTDKIVLIGKEQNGEKKHKIIENPIFSYYITLPEYWDGKVRDHISIDKVKKFGCNYNDLFKSMAENIKDQKILNYYRDSCNSPDYYSRMKDMHLDYRYHNTDMNICDYYIDKFLDMYPTTDENGNPQNYFGLSKAFFDIEVDSSNIIGFPDPSQANCPINIITLVDDNFNVYILTLNYNFEGYNKVINNFDNDILPKLKEKYKNIEESAKKEFNFELITFDKEEDLIKEFFSIINYVIKPDICTAWNIAFDFVYLYNRLIKLNLDPNKIISHEDFKYKYVDYKLDMRNQDPGERNDTYIVTSYTMYMDSMCLYANLSKMTGKKESYSLDYIGELETGMNKDKFEDTNIKTAHLDNYEQFFLYNIQDSIMLEEIERKTKNFDTIYSFSIMTRTRMDKVLKKTISLRNFAAKFYEKNGFYISNNRSKLFPKTNEKIDGALTYRRTLNSLNCWNFLNG